MNARKLLIAGMIILLTWTQASVAAESSLEEQMTQQEFEQAGLEKLSQDQLKFLNSWLNQRQKMPQPEQTPSQATPQPRPSNPATLGFKPKSEHRDMVVSRIDGEFTGWSGRTTFKLENGQIWRQSDGKTYRHRPTANPKVEIKPKAMGAWKLYVDGLNRSVKVHRIK